MIAEPFTYHSRNFARSGRFFLAVFELPSLHIRGSAQNFVSEVSNLNVLFVRRRALCMDRRRDLGMITIIKGKKGIDVAPGARFSLQ